MTLQSMTGFARSEGSSGRNRFAWELRSVNGKGLDVRLRLPPGLERLEQDVRRMISEKFSRGNLQASLNLTITETKVEAVLNRDALAAVLALRSELGELVDPSPLRLDTLMGIRGLVDIREPEEDEEAIAARDAGILVCLEDALGQLQNMREGEGAALGSVLNGPRRPDCRTDGHRRERSVAVSGRDYSQAFHAACNPHPGSAFARS